MEFEKYKISKEKIDNDYLNHKITLKEFKNRRKEVLDELLENSKKSKGGQK